jgi:hypothetical protein
VAQSSGTSGFDEFREHLGDALEEGFVVIRSGRSDQIERSTHVEHGCTLCRGTTGSRVEGAFVCGRKLASAFGDVQDNAQSSPLELIGEIASASGQPLDDVVRFGNELDRQLIDIELLVIERHRNLSFFFAGFMLSSNSMTC